MTQEEKYLTNIKNIQHIHRSFANKRRLGFGVFFLANMIGLFLVSRAMSVEKNDLFAMLYLFSIIPIGYALLWMLLTFWAKTKEQELARIDEYCRLNKESWPSVYPH